MNYHLEINISIQLFVIIYKISVMKTHKENKTILFISFWHMLGHFVNVLKTLLTILLATSLQIFWFWDRKHVESHDEKKYSVSDGYRET